MRLRKLLLACWGALAAAGCPAVNSPPCSSDADCPGGRCRRSACGPTCLEDTECGTEQLCSGGKCVPRPECAADGDCAQGFVCKAGLCQCTADSACARNQSCVNGRCEIRKRCQGDEDCAGTGRRCEVTQGLCIPPCSLPTDCAPGTDPRLAAALYVCTEGRCLRRCISDPSCGPGLICESGTCAVAQCRTTADCPSGQYCTDPDFGRCREYQLCSRSSDCPKNYECRAFLPGQCPPGFDCTRTVCQELPRCLIDTDCVNPANPTQRRAFCEDGHCQPTTRCTSPTQCAQGMACIGDLCVPGACRGHPDCPPAQACVDGACASAPAPADVNLLSIAPKSALAQVGDTVKFTLIAYRLDGSSFPLWSGSFAVLDPQGNPSGAVSVDSTGRATALAAGSWIIRGSVSGANVAPQDASLTVYAAAPAGQKRVLVVEAASGSPIAGVKVLGCDSPPASGPCPSPVEIVTGADGQALFPFTGATASFSAASTAVRSDGLPRYDRVSVLATSAGDVLLPLSENPVHGAAGYNGSISFADVHSTGAYWAGYAVLSMGDLPDLDLATLLGEPFMVDLPGILPRFPVPGSVVLYTSPGFGIPQEVKGRSLGLGQAGSRTAVAFAGRSDIDMLQALRSTELLAYTGAMDYAVQPGVSAAHRPRVPDYADVDGDGLCAQPQKCPQGSEDVPDYVSFAPLALRPGREQLRRTEIVIPNLPVYLDTVIVSAVETGYASGVLPLGFSSRGAGPPGQDGTRPVQSILLRSGAPYGGVEIGEPGIWALAASASQSGGLLGSRGTVSARLTRSPLLPAKVLIAPFLPAALGSSFSPSSRTLSPGQPAWNSVYSMGGELARVVLTGTQQRHQVYFVVQGSQTAVRVPDSPAAPGIDPAGQANARLEVVAMDLKAGVTAGEALTLAGPNLWNLSLAIDGYSRFER
ncbi:MAG: hypothetical protein HYZ28_17285 [Myxococcales bacterium]|nr:hypothetical protein [Myxococcales bacterium]